MWQLEGLDQFDHGRYPLPGEYESEEEAVQAARDRLAHLEQTQPTSSSGGQDGIQDAVFIIRPDDSKYRFLE